MQQATGPVDEDAGNQFLTRVTSFEPVIFSSLDAIVARKDAFKGECLTGIKFTGMPSFIFPALPVGGIPALVLQDLKDLKSGTVTFANALITNAPVSVSSDQIALEELGFIFRPRDPSRLLQLRSAMILLRLSIRPSLPTRKSDMERRRSTVVDV